MSNPPQPGRADKDAYLDWRRRLADRQAAQRVTEEPTAPQTTNRWDPNLLFDTPATLEIEQAPEPVLEVAAEPIPLPATAADDETIDLRVVPAPAAAVEAGSPVPAQHPARDRSEPDAIRAPRREPTREIDLREGVRSAAPVATGPDERRRRYDAVMARLERSPKQASKQALADTSVADELRALNEQRLDGSITDAEFRRRKAAIFERSSR